MIARRWVLRLGLLGAGLAVGVSGGTTVAAWTSTVDTPAGTVQAVADWVGPPIRDVRALKSEGGTPGFVRPDGQFRVCSEIAPDSGNPATGFRDLSLDLAGLAANQTRTALATPPAGACAANHNDATALLRVPAAAAAGERTVTATTRDQGGNVAVRSIPVTVDATVPNAMSFSAANGGTTATSAGTVEGEDRLTFTFSEPIEPGSVIAGWSGEPTTITTTFSDGGGKPTAPNPDRLQLTITQGTTTTALPITPGMVGLGRNYVGATFSFTSTLTRTAGGDAFTVDLGTATSPNVVRNTTSAAVSWAPGNALKDRAWHSAATTAAPDAAGPDF